jgi:FAD/FMN-containing dehydrogenase
MKLVSSEGWTVVPAGAATWLDVGSVLKRVNIVLSTERLNRIIEHEPADLVAVAESGVTLNNFNRVLSQNGQWLPLDPPDDGRATVGGVVATGLSGAQKYGYGPPRGFVIGMRVVLADGRVIKAGGRVVKNVAGYDLCKLFTGSYGTLGIIVELNFKLRPLPFETRTVLASGKLENLLAGANRAIDARLFPIAVELLSTRLAFEAELSEGTQPLLLLRFAGSRTAVSWQAKTALEVLAHEEKRKPNLFASDDEELWRTLAALPLRFSNGLVWRVGIRPTDVAGFLSDVEKDVVSASLAKPMWHAGVGCGRIRVIEDMNATDDKTVARIARLQAKAQTLNSALILENANPEMKNRLAVWGKFGNTLPLQQRVKQQLDPEGILSPGRFG